MNTTRTVMAGVMIAVLRTLAKINQPFASDLGSTL